MIIIGFDTFKKYDFLFSNFHNFQNYQHGFIHEVEQDKNEYSKMKQKSFVGKKYKKCKIRCFVPKMPLPTFQSVKM